MKKFMCFFVSSMLTMLLSVSMCFAHSEKVKVTHVEHYKIVVKRDNGAKFELLIGNGCPAIWNYNKRDVTLRSDGDKFLGRNSKVILKQENQQCPVTSYARIKAPKKNDKDHELVRVVKVRSSHVIIRRDNGVEFKIRVGAGCPSLWRYEGKKVRINSGYGFLDGNSHLLIRDIKQQCDIKSYEPY